MAFRVLLAIFGAVSFAACRGERETPKPPATSPVGTISTDTLSLSDSTSPPQWDTNAGRGMLVWSDFGSDTAQIILPSYTDSDGTFAGGSTADVRPLAHSRWDLFGRSGAFGTAQVIRPEASDSSDGCVTWPQTNLGGARSGWRTALETGRAVAVPFDSVDAMKGADSARFIVDVTRLASAVPGASDPVFASIPFVVQSAYRFRTGDIEGIVGLVRRSILSEANPREEHLFFVAERPVGSTDSYHVAYSTRSAGEEGDVPVTDVLSMVSLVASHRPALIVSHEYEDGGAIWWIERVSPGRWRAIWRSAMTGC